MHLKSINAINLKTTIKFLLIMPWAIVGRMWGKDTWIITERSDQARDNGYCFYKFVREEYPEQRIIYLIDKSAPDYKKICKYKSIIQFDSWAHYYYYCLSKVHISAHVGGCNPSNSPITRYLKKLFSIRDVFLPHGVSYAVSEFCLKKYANIDLFICSGFPEYENVLRHYGYTEKEVAYTGFPRLDLWHDIIANPKQLLLMPTWRLYIAQDPDVDFCKTNYYRNYQTLINNPELKRLLEEYGLDMVFYLHHGMQKYAHFFSTDCPEIRIIYPTDDCDIQDVLKTSALLVTDYSSVHFDFAYMNKPVFYYQFDGDEFFARQYSASEFDFEKDGFGPVLNEQIKLIESIKESIRNGYSIPNQYKERMHLFYPLYDTNNSERVYTTIKEKCVEWYAQ